MTARAFFSATDCQIAPFNTLIGRRTDPALLTHAESVEHNIPVYAAGHCHTLLRSPDTRHSLLSEWAQIIGTGAGALALRDAYQDLTVIDRATDVFTKIIAEERACKAGRGDHFAKAGANDRIWNVVQKLCVADPELFALYFGNPVITGVCEAWLGPNFQMTAQVNLVRPGAPAQDAHRDYHLGFQTAEEAAQYPAHIHAVSAALTLQGGIAHCDMPIESGPTKLLPFSQLYEPGYIAFTREDFRAAFETHCVQLPLNKGDALFFNPALFHAAGANVSTDIDRLANLVQVSSAFGRAMESVDRADLCRRLYPVLRDLQSKGRMGSEEVSAAIACAAEGYAFPTNLDTDPPLDGLAPESQAALMHRALASNMDTSQFDAALTAREAARRP